MSGTAAPAIDAPLRGAPLVVLVLSVAVGLSHILLGPNFVLDDWFNVNEGVFGGVFGATAPELVISRPGSAIAYGLSFGVFGAHPLPIVVLASLVNVGVAQMLYQVAKQYVPAQAALAITCLWVVLPNHMSLEIWPSTIMVSMSLLALLPAVYLIGRTATPGIVAPILLALLASALYEGTVPMAGLLMLVVPKIRFGKVNLPLVIGGALTQGALTLWIFTHLHSSKAANDFISLGAVIDGLYGEAIIARPAAVPAALGFLIGFLVLIVVAGRNRVFEPPQKLVLAGFVVVVTSLLPFLRYFYSPIGPGDRVNYLASIGGAMTIVGLGWACWSQQHIDVRKLVVAIGAIMLVFVISARVEQTRAWNRAGDDGIAIINEIERRGFTADTHVVLGPSPTFYRNVAPFLDPSNVRGAMGVVFNDVSATGTIVYSEEDFLSYPADQRLDLRELLPRD